MDNPQPSPCQDVPHAIHTLNNLLTIKLHGDHLIFPSEQPLNASIRGHVRFLKTHWEFGCFEQEYSSRFRIHLWLLESMVAKWNDVRPLNVRESVELVRLRTELEDAAGWRVAVGGVRGGDDDDDDEDLSW